METPLFENRIEIETLNQELSQVRQEISKVVVGQQHAIDLILIALLSNGHILLEGVPGVAKTLTAKLLAKTLDVPFSRIQFTPDLMPSDVIGTNVFNPQQVTFEFKAGPIFSQIILIDEINRAPAKTQAALFEVMEERTITIDGVQHTMQDPFMVLATQNPVEHEGTYALPEAQLDRFLFKIIIAYPNTNEELEILKRHHENFNLHDMIATVQKVMSSESIAKLKNILKQVKVDEFILKYITQIIQKTRSHGSLQLGASPRASVALLQASKGFAAIQGRDFVTPDDVVHISLPVLRHRIMLSGEKEMEGVSADDVLLSLIKEIEVPR
ncbi:MAG: MoxR family ATPase [Chitinophagaceae bacterium]